MTRDFYWHASQLAEDGVMPGVLAIGDSWFWYPFPGGALLHHLAPYLRRRERIVFAVGHNGAEAADYVDGVYREEVAQALKLYGDGLTEVLISGGGNDFAGFNDLRPLLRSDNRDATTAAECFLPGNEWPSLGWLLGVVQDSLSRLIRQIQASAPRAHIYLHNYDYAIPSGKGVLGGEGWLLPALERTFVPPELRQACIRHAIDGLSDVQQALTRTFGGTVTQIDSRGTLSAGDWANEMHPTGKGFEKIVRERWVPVLAERGAAAS